RSPDENETCRHPPDPGSRGPCVSSRLPTQDQEAHHHGADHLRGRSSPHGRDVEERGERRMNVKDFCKRYSLTEDQFYGRDKYEGSLYLRSLTSIPEGFNPTVGGSLYLGSLTSIPEGFNPTVGGSLDLRSLTSIPERFNPTVRGSLDLGSLTSSPEGFNPTVGGSLYLGSLTSIPEGFNPTVGGYLDLGSLISIPEGFNTTVGGS